MSDFWLGIAPQYRVPLAALLAFPLLAVQLRRIIAGHAGLGAAWAVRLRSGWRAADEVTRWSAWLLAAVAAVHLTLPLGSAVSLPLAAGFLMVGTAAAWLAVRAVCGRPWRRQTVLLLVLLLIGYAVQVARGRTEPDQVGMTAAVLELALLSLVSRRVVARIGTVLLVVLFGTTVWLAAFARHDHDGVDRLQAGVVQRGAGPPPTAEQVAAARSLAERTTAATLQYRDIAAAEADGYRAAGPREGLQVHFDHKGHQADGRILDPQAPEQLVYAVQGGHALLLGVVYQMPAAGERGPSIGGEATRWHAHDVCVGLLPPGFGVVSPYGSCPGLTLSVTIAEMMHVWVVDPPGGPYVEHLDDAWVRQKLAGAG